VLKVAFVQLRSSLLFEDGSLSSNGT